jgi:flagellar hook-associated protein 2
MPLINFSGIASGIDTSALIEAILDADRKVKIAPLEKKVTETNEETGKLKEFKTLLKSIQDMASDFRSLNGGALSKSANSTDETVATATADNDAFNTSVSLTVSTIASNSTASFNNTFASGDTVINSGAVASTVAITIGSGGTPEVVNVSVDNTTTVTEFINDFNSASTRAIATAVNVGTSASPSYKIVISTLEEGTLTGDIASIADASLFFSSGNTITHASNATFSVSGISGSITRYSNSIDDVIPGVNLQLVKGGGVSTTVTVNDDADASTETIQEFVDKYNEIVAFMLENNLIAPSEDTPNGLNKFGPLAKTRIDDGALSALRSAIASSNYSSGSEIKILADLGITSKQDGTINFSSATFKSAIAKESKSVKEILADLGDLMGALESSGGTIDTYTKFGGLLDTTTNSNDESVDDLNERISDYEALLAEKEANLRAQFARLESLMGGLQSKQAALTSALAGLQQK